MAEKMKTKTEYDLPHLEDLQRLGGALSARSVHRKRGFALMLGSLLTGTGLGLVVRGEQLWVCLGCCAVGVPLLCWGAFFYRIRALMARRAVKGQLPNEYSLEKGEILATQGKNSSRYRYGECQQLFESRLNFFLALKDGQALMLDKANLTGGTVDELRMWLEEKCGKAIWVGKKR